MRRVFQHNFISKANLKNPEQGFLVHRFYLPKKQKIVSGRAGFQLKSDRIWVIFSPIFTLMGTLKWYNLSRNMPKHFIFDKLSDKKKPFEDSPSGFEIRF